MPAWPSSTIGLALGRLENLVAQADHQRHAESARHDRRMGGRGSGGERQPTDPPGSQVQLGDVNGPEIARDEDRWPERRRGRRRRSCEQPGSADPQAPNVCRAGGEHCVLDLLELLRVPFRGLEDSAGGGRLLRQSVNLLGKRRVLGHQSIRVEDVGLVDVPLGTKPVGGLAELGGEARERREGALLLHLPAPAVQVRLDVPQHQRPTHGDASRRREPRQVALGHCSEATDRSSAARMSTVEVAPGSWWPMLRSPRYDARPFWAWSGTVAFIPCSAASRAAASACGNRGSVVDRGTKDAHGRAEGVDHGLVALLGGAELDDAVQRGLERRRQLSAVELVHASQ